MKPNFLVGWSTTNIHMDKNLIYQGVLDLLENKGVNYSLPLLPNNKDWIAANPNAIEIATWIIAHEHFFL